jgi:hypothetical protein
MADPKHLRPHPQIYEKLREIRATALSEQSAYARQHRYLQHIGAGTKYYPTFSRSERKILIKRSQDPNFTTT